MERLRDQDVELDRRKPNRASVDERLDHLSVDQGKALASHSVGQVLELVLKKQKIVRHEFLRMVAKIIFNSSWSLPV